MPQDRVEAPPEQLPDDLAALGNCLEVAAQRTLTRRRAIRRALLNGLAAIAIGTPAALGLAATDVAPSDGSVQSIAAATAQGGLDVADVAGLRLVLRHVPELSGGGATGRICLKDPDCRASGAVHMSFRTTSGVYDSVAGPDSSAG